MRDDNFNPSDLQAAEDSGFGRKFSTNARLVNADGSFNILRKGQQKESAYEFLVNTTWVKFFIYTFLAFMLTNLFFAILYYLNGIENIAAPKSNPFQELLYGIYFSIHTFTSVGYGSLHPRDNYTNIVASFNAFVGLLSFALATGLLFSRFSKARVNIKFSNNMIISPYENGKALMFRLVNFNSNLLMNMQASATMTWVEVINGENRRKFKKLNLVLDFIYLFPLNWTIVHKIDDESPFFHKTKEELIASNAEILVMIRGYDDTYGQYIYKNHSYFIDSLVYDAQFKTMYYADKNTTVIELDKIHDFSILNKKDND